MSGPGRPYYLARLKVPPSATEQLKAAYVPVRTLPSNVAVALNGQVRGLLGVALSETVLPDAVPLSDPLLLPKAVAVPHVPLKELPD